MAENYKFLYGQLKKMLEMYQDEIVPQMREEIEEMKRKRVEVVRCKDCKHFDSYRCWICTMHSLKETEDESGANIYMMPDDFCSYGERRKDA